MKVFKWRFPTVEEFANEFKTEPSLQELYDADGYSLLTRDTYRIDPQMQIFLRHMECGHEVDRFSIETIRVSDMVTHDLEHYKATCIDDLAEKTKYMGKQPASIMSALLSDGMPYMLLSRKRDGKLTMLGGRTRASLCVLYNINPVVMLLNEQMIGEDVLKHIKLAYDSLSSDLISGNEWSLAEQVVVGEIDLSDLSEETFELHYQKNVIRMLVKAIQKHRGVYDE